MVTVIRTQTWTVNVAGTASVLRFSSPDTVIGGTATPAKADTTSSAGDASLLEFIGWPQVSGLGSPQSLPSSTVPLAAWKRHRTQFCCLSPYYVLRTKEDRKREEGTNDETCTFLQY